MFSSRRVLGIWGLLLPVAVLVILACGIEKETPAAGPDIAPRTGSTGDVSPDATQAPASFTMELQDAPIESISIIVLETDPPQYRADVTVVQPNSCATFGHVQAAQDPGETEIVLLARNEVMVGEGVGCDEAISTFVQPVPLGIDFEPGVTYTVAGGGATASFTAQGEPPFFSYDRFFAELDSLVEATEAGEVAQPFTSVLARLVEMSGGTIQVYEFEMIDDAIEMVVQVENSPVIDWIDTPHFFRRGNVAVIYVGQDQGVLKAVSAVTRDFFARPFEPDVPPEAPTETNTPTPTPAPPGEHRLFVKVIPEGDGFRFIGELIGGADNERSLYCVGSTWEPGDGFNITAMPGCLEYTPDIEIQRHFEFTHTYSEPGVYQVVLKVGPLTSRSVEVVYEPADPLATATPAPPGEHQLLLKVMPRGDGFLFVGELVGGADNERSLYCVGIIWELGDGTSSGIFPACAFYTSNFEVQRHFEYSHTYEEPGVYEVVLQFGPLTSNPVEVVYEPADYQATATPAPSGSGPDPAQAAEMVWPTLLNADPEVARPGQRVEILGQGGYLFTPPSGYDESARGFEIYFDGELAGEISCYVNRCEGEVTVPAGVYEGRHAITSEGGSVLELDVRG